MPYVECLVLSVVSGIHWRSWTVCCQHQGEAAVRGFFREGNCITDVAKNCWFLVIQSRSIFSWFCCVLTCKESQDTPPALPLSRACTWGDYSALLVPGWLQPTAKSGIT